VNRMMGRVAQYLIILLAYRNGRLIH